jgi:hypothetical protein
LDLRVQETSLKEASDELSGLRSRIAGLGASLLIVPAATMRCTQEQFQLLTDEFERHGDTVAATVRGIRSRRVVQAITMGLIERKNEKSGVDDWASDRPSNSYPPFCTTASHEQKRVLPQYGSEVPQIG